MTRSQTMAWRVRWLLLGAALLCWSFGIYWTLGTRMLGVMGFVYPMSEDGWSSWVFVTAWLGMFFLTQWVFLAPGKSVRIRLRQTGRPLRRAVWAAALMAGLLTVGLLACAAELCSLWEAVFSLWYILGALAVCWVIWAAVFWTYWRAGDGGSQYYRMLRGLMGGSVLELLVATPVHIWYTPQSDKDCYCARGSYTGLILGGTVLCWTFGPGLILLLLREKNRRAPLLGNDSLGRTEQNH